MTKSSPAREARRLLLAGALALTAVLSGRCQQPLEKTDTARVEAAPIRGVTISTHGNGRDWGSDVMPGTIEELANLGANWITVHPYASIRGNGEVRVRAFDPVSPPEMLTRPIRDAHQAGMKILIKPHLAYWGSPFSWRGEIRFDDATEWKRFWTDYRDWIVGVARACKDADAFAVGTELDATLTHTEEWRRIIREVRAVTNAKLTFASNWTDYQRVPFWRELDFIGVQAYFPVCDADRPTAAQLETGWRSILDHLTEFADRVDRDVVFTELGYNRSWAAAREPWNYDTDGPEAEVLQARCLRVALQQIERHPRVQGSFLWKWFPGRRPNGRNFQLATPRMRNAIRDVWID